MRLDRDADSLVHSGRDGAIAVPPPRLEERIVVDGVLDEPARQQAARLIGFSRHFPTDDRPPRDSTEVSVG